MFNKMDIFEVIKSSLPQYTNIKFEEIYLRRLTGITNVTYLAEYQGNENISPRKMIVRKFGTQAQDVFIDVKQEK